MDILFGRPNFCVFNNCNFFLYFVDSRSLIRKSKCLRVIQRCHHRRWWFPRRTHCKRYCERENEYSASISLDEIKAKLENLNGNHISEEEDNAFKDLSYCLRFNFRECSPNVTLTVDGVINSQFQQLTTWGSWHWVEAEYNISAILSQFQVNSVNSLSANPTKW